MFKTMMIGLVWVFCIGISFVVIRKNFIVGLILGVAMVFGAYTATKFISVGSTVADSVVATEDMVKKLPASADAANAKTELPGMISKIMEDAPVDLETNLFALANRQKGAKNPMEVMFYLGSVLTAIGEVYKDDDLLDKLEAKFGKDFIFRLTPEQIVQGLQRK